MTVVVDASVAAKWVLPPADEELVPQALGLLAQYEHGLIQFVVPDLFWAELGNILWKAVRHGRFSAFEAAEAADAMSKRAFPTLLSREVLSRALQLAISTGRTCYDCVYIALALHIGSEFVTADQRLANAVAASLPVKWLGVM